MRYYDVIITLHNELKDKVYQENVQVTDMIDLSRTLISLKPRKGYRIVSFQGQEFDGLV